MKKLLVIGAGFLQSFVIKKATEMGYETFALDGNRDAVGFKYSKNYKDINIVDKESCLEFARSNKIDAVLTAATDYGVITSSYISRELELPGLNYEVACLIKDKYKVRKCFFENNVDDMNQFFMIDVNTDVKLLSKKLEYPVIVKPCDGSGSRGASRVDNSNDLFKACKVAIDNSLSKRAIIESFIVGKEYGVESIVVDGKITVLGIMGKWVTNPPYYAELGHFLPSDLDDYLEEKIKLYVTNAIKALGVNIGSINMDIIITEDNKVYLIDVGARMGGNLIGSHIIPYGTGIDYITCVIQNAFGEYVDLKVSNKSNVATKILAFKTGVVSDVPNIRELELKYNVEIYSNISKGIKIREYRNNLDGYGYIVSKSPDKDVAIQNVNLVYDIFNDKIV